MGIPQKVPLILGNSHMACYGRSPEGRQPCSTGLITYCWRGAECGGSKLRSTVLGSLQKNSILGSVLGFPLLKETTMSLRSPFCSVFAVSAV